RHNRLKGVFVVRARERTRGRERARTDSRTGQETGQTEVRKEIAQTEGTGTGCRRQRSGNDGLAGVDGRELNIVGVNWMKEGVDLAPCWSGQTDKQDACQDEFVHASPPFSRRGCDRHRFSAIKRGRRIACAPMASRSKIVVRFSGTCLQSDQRRAVRSSCPYMRLKFCTATPLAPRIRLSAQARMTTRPRTTRTVRSRKLVPA